MSCEKFVKLVFSEQLPPEWGVAGLRRRSVNRYRLTIQAGEDHCYKHRQTKNEQQRPGN